MITQLNLGVVRSLDKYFEFIENYCPRFGPLFIISGDLTFSFVECRNVEPELEEDIEEA